MAKINFKKKLTKVGGIAVGVAGSNALGNKFAPNANPYMVGVAKIAVGAMLPDFVKGEFMDGVGSGIIADGVYQIGNKVAPDYINGYSETRENSVGRSFQMEEDSMDVNGVGNDEYTDINGTDDQNDAL